MHLIWIILLINQTECDLLDLGVNQIKDDGDGSSSSTITQHDCHHCCHYGHAINISFKHQIRVDATQKIADHHSSFVSHIVYNIKRPPRIVA